MYLDKGSSYLFLLNSFAPLSYTSPITLPVVFRKALPNLIVFTFRLFPFLISF